MLTFTSCFQSIHSAAVTTIHNFSFNYYAPKVLDGEDKVRVWDKETLRGGQIFLFILLNLHLSGWLELCPPHIPSPPAGTGQALAFLSYREWRGLQPLCY